MAELTDILVIASDRLLVGESLPQITADFPEHRGPLEPLLEAAAALSVLQAVEMPSADAQAADRRDFVAQLESLEPVPVSFGLLARLKGRYARYRDNKQMASPISKKEAQPMTILLAKAAVVLALAFGALGGSAAAVANSLPDTPIYAAKLALEEVRLALTDDPGRVAELHLNYAINRAQEIQALAMDGVIAGEELVGQLEFHLGQTLKLAAGLPDQDMQRVLLTTRERTKSQAQALVQLQDQVREQTRLRLREAAQLMVQAQEQARLGLEDPAQFRWQYQHQEGQPVSPPQEQDRRGGGAGQQGPGCEDCEPAGNQNQFGQDSGQYGPNGPEPGPGCPDCDPAGIQNQYGPQPDQPGPGEPGGSDDPTCTDCEPAGDQNQYGPQPDQPGPGEPGGNENPSCTDCEPAGDQNQYGPQPDQPGPGGPGGNEDPSCTDCEPEGDENQYGPQPDQPGPAEPGGAEDPPCSDCEPAGDGNQGSAGSGEAGGTDGGTGSSGSGGSDAASGGTESPGSGDSGSTGQTDQGGSGGRS